MVVRSQSHYLIQTVLERSWCFKRTSQSINTEPPSTILWGSGDDQRLLLFPTGFHREKAND